MFFQSLLSFLLQFYSNSVGDCGSSKLYLSVCLLVDMVELFLFFMQRDRFLRQRGIMIMLCPDQTVCSIQNHQLPFVYKTDLFWIGEGQFANSALSDLNWLLNVLVNSQVFVRRESATPGPGLFFVTLTTKCMEQVNPNVRLL